MTDPITSTYAQEYRRLIDLSRKDHFRLALANFSMAVNAQSDPNIIRFYQVAYPWAPLSIEANAAHSQLIRELTKQNCDVSFVDTHPHLDGESSHFLDLVHFAPSGDRQMAENVFKALRATLQSDLRR